MIYCPLCNSDSRVLDTRTDLDSNTVYRRRICDKEHIFLTTEIICGLKRLPAFVQNLKNQND